jgi:hypothetical protein
MVMVGSSGECGELDTTCTATAWRSADRGGTWAIAPLAYAAPTSVTRAWMAVAAAQRAHDMSRAGTVDDFKNRARELRIICDTCHALYSENQ